MSRATARANLAHELLLSLDGPDADAEDAWNEEARRRADAVETGAATLEEGPAVRARLHAALKK